MTYECPECGKEYPIPPKACTCTSHPMKQDKLFWKISGEYSDVEITEQEFAEIKTAAVENDTGYRIVKMLFSAGTPGTDSMETEEEILFISKADFDRFMHILENRGSVTRFDIRDRTVYKRKDSLST